MSGNLSLESAVESIVRRVLDEEAGSQKEKPAESAIDLDTQKQIKQYILISHKPYLTRKEAAIYLGVSERSIAEWANRPAEQNPFPESHAGGEPRSKRDRIDEWAEKENRRRRFKVAS